ncbi:MAG: hypothetical protein ACOCT9_00565 [archaeon]
MDKERKNNYFSVGDRVKIFGKYKGEVFCLFDYISKNKKHYGVHLTPPITKDEIERIVVAGDEIELIYDNLEQGDKFIYQNLIWKVKDKHTNQNNEVVYFAINKNERASAISAASIEEVVCGN